MSFTLCSGDVKILSKKDVFPISGGTCLSNESFSFQLYIENESLNGEIKIQSDILVNSYRVREIKGTYYNNKKTDKYYIKTENDVYPDLLTPANYIYYLKPEETLNLYFEVPAESKKPGKHAINIDVAGEELSFILDVKKDELDDADIMITNWMHLDGICNIYKVSPFTNEFYRIFDKFLTSYVKMGNNMLLIPLFTPPLDTAVGHERLTTQLVKIAKVDGKYQFDFSELEKYIDFAYARGIKYFEFSHLFTQWGGNFCPKIMVKNGKKIVKEFGWENESDSKEYLTFLKQFFKAFVPFVKDKGIFNNSYMHLTDEPTEKHVEKYEKLYKFIKRNNGGMKTMDAISHYEFAKKGIVDVPVVSMSSPDIKFFDDTPHMLYYCIGVDKKYLTNRYFHMPLFRAMVLGFDLFTNDAKGFLHWGYNFYNSQFSREPINPYVDASAGGGFAAGDPFIVYPGSDNVEYSLRYFAVLKAFELYRLLKTAERIIGRRKVLSVMKEYGFVNMHKYTKNLKKFYAFKDELYSLI